MTELEDQAIQAVTEALSDIDGDLLAAIEGLQEKWQQELSSVQATARSLLTNVLSERESLRSSLSTAAELWRILKPTGADSMHPGVDQLPQTETGFLANAEQMAMVKALQNVSHSIFYLEAMQAAPSALEKAEQALKKLVDDGLDRVIPGNAAMLVEAHTILTAVERLRDLVLLEAPEVQREDERLPWFSKAEETRATLESIVLKDIFSDIVGISLQNPRLLVSAARIIQAEEEEDLWWTKYVERGAQIDNGVHVRLSGAKQYRMKALDSVLGSLRQKFREKEAELGIGKSLSTEANDEINPDSSSSSPLVDMANILEWIENRRSENETVRRFVVPCLPPSFLVSSMYEKELHRQFMKLITSLLHLAKPDGSMKLSEDDLLMLTSWYCKYKEEVGDHDEAIDSFLNEENRERLISALQKHCASRIHLKVISAIAADRKLSIQDLSQLNQAIDYDDDVANKEVTLPRHSELPDVVLGCINEQVRRMLALSVQGMDHAIAETAAKCLLVFQKEIKDAMLKEESESSEEKYRLYACATANNMARCLEYTEDLRDLFIPLASDSDRSDIEERMEEVIDGFRASASMALKVLIKGMDANLRGHAKRLFAPHTGTEIMLDIIGTLDDYFSEYQSYLLPYHFEHLAIESLKRVVVWYLAPFLNSCQQRMPANTIGRFPASRSFDSPHGRYQEAQLEEIGIPLLPVSTDVPERRRSAGLTSLNGEAVVAQIDKDRSNLTEFMAKKVVLYQKKQLQPTVEPMQSIRSLYTCPPTTSSLADAFRDAKSVIERAMRPPWVVECGVSGRMTSGVAEMIWESRKDVSPVVLLEAMSRIRSFVERREHGSPIYGRASSFDEGRRNMSRSSDIGAPFSDRIPNNDSSFQDPITTTSSLLWAPSTSRSLQSRDSAVLDF